MRTHSKLTVVIAAGAAVVASTGVAYAYWTTQGSGTGEATAGTTATADAIILEQTTAIAGLYPGGPAADIVVKATNPADFHQVVGEVTVTPTYPAACPEENWTLTNGDDSYGDLAPNGEATDVVGTIALNETGVNQDACKSVTPTFAFSSAAGE